ncbi:hypothetical protein H0H87_005310, partial [Tephrocybe sp. NHM501043]
MKLNLIGFHHIKGKHMGDWIACAIAHLLEQESHFTADNVSNNHPFNSSYTALYQPTVLAQPKEALIPCFPHVINLCAQVAIKSINGGTVNNEGNGNDYMNAPPNLALHSLMLLAKVCCIITAIQALGQYMEAFNALVLHGNEMNWWIGDDVDGTPKQLKPLTKAMKGTIPKFKDMKKFALTLEEWNKVDGIIKVLQYLHKVQIVMANQKLPVLAAAIPTFEQFMSKWERAAKHYDELSEPIDA